MKWFIASDLHGSEFYTKQMITAFERENADKILILGDILYHGPEMIFLKTMLLNLLLKY